MANIRTIDYKGFNAATGSIAPGFLIWSGSLALSQSSYVTNYTGLGMEIIANSASYMRFRSNPNELDIRTNKFILGSQGAGNAFISGSGNGTIAISSSNFELTEGGDVTMQGTITAEAGGTIGGFTIGTRTLEAGAFGPTIVIDSGNPSSTPFAGAGAQFKVRGAGANDFTRIYYDSITDWGVEGSNSTDGLVFQLGSTNQIAGWSFDNEKLTGNNIIISSSGDIQTADFQSALFGTGQGYKLGADGIAEFEEARIRGTLSTAVFEKETVSAVGGALIVANATALKSGSLILSGSIATASVDSAAGFVSGEYILAKATSSTGFTEEIMKVHSVDTSANTMVVSRSMNGNLIPSMSAGQVLVSQGTNGTGFILLNATSGSETPYIDITERTGSGVNDLQIKSRLGDLSGITDNSFSDGVTGFGIYTQNGFFKGKIELASPSDINLTGINLYTHGPLAYHPRSLGDVSNDQLPNATWNDTQDNAIEYVTGPFGGQELAITCYPDSSNDGDGGFNSDAIPIDSGSAYMFVTYIKRKTHAASGSAYFGLRGRNAAGSNNYLLTNQVGLAVDNNPYFFSGDVTPAGETSADALDRWFLHVGYVYPSGSGYDATRKSVCYDLTTGLTGSYSSANEKTYLWTTGTTHAKIRVYHYYNTAGDGNTKYQEIARPAIYKMDGTEPTIQSLLSNVSEGGNTVIDGASITTGKIRSTNFGASQGSELDLNNGTILLGGSSDPDFKVDTSGAITASAGTIANWTINPDKLQGGKMMISSSGFITTHTASNKTRLEIDGQAEVAEIKFISQSSNLFEFTTNIQQRPVPTLGKGNNATATCPGLADTGLGGLELKQEFSGIMYSVGGGNKELELFPGFMRLIGDRTDQFGDFHNDTALFRRQRIGCSAAQADGGTDTQAIKAEYLTSLGQTTAGAKRSAIFCNSQASNTSTTETMIGLRAEASNNGSGDAMAVYGHGGTYSFYGAAGAIKILDGGAHFGSDVDSSATNTTTFGKSGNSGTGLNIINIYGEGDGQDGQTANEIRMHGHEGRGQGIRYSDEDHPDKYWWCGTTYEGYQNIWSVGYDDSTQYQPRRRASILSVIGPDTNNSLNSGLEGHGGIRIQEWDNNSNSSYSTKYIWIMHNGTDGRFGVRSGHYDFHHGGNENTGTHNIRFGDDGSLKAYNLNSYSSGGSTVKWFSGEFKYSSSTRKVKKEIKSIKDSNSAVVNFNKLRPVEYKQKLDDAITYGFIAEEVAEVDPKLAVWDKDYARDDKGQLIDTGDRIDNKVVNKLDSDKIVPSDLEDRAILALAVAKIQQLEERIKELENR